MNGDGIEAQLDIQFIMGTAPGIKTEFYEQANSDFCADLQNWTTLLLSDEDSPRVHSVSYGWQGNLTQVCALQRVRFGVRIARPCRPARAITLSNCKQNTTCLKGFSHERYFTYMLLSSTARRA